MISAGHTVPDLCIAIRNDINARSIDLTDFNKVPLRVIISGKECLSVCKIQNSLRLNGRAKEQSNADDRPGSVLIVCSDCL